MDGIYLVSHFLFLSGKIQFRLDPKDDIMILTSQTIDPTNTDTLNNISRDGVRVAGVVNIPICPAAEVVTNWVAQNKGKNKNFPCNP
jgi:hypothetical protein